jgi:hypothetical protein
MSESQRRSKQWPLFTSELIGMAILEFAGLSVVICVSGTGSPFAVVEPSEVLKRPIVGFRFDTTGALVALFCRRNQWRTDESRVFGRADASGAWDVCATYSMQCIGEKE